MQFIPSGLKVYIFSMSLSLSLSPSLSPLCLCHLLCLHLCPLFCLILCLCLSHFLCLCLSLKLPLTLPSSFYSSTSGSKVKFIPFSFSLSHQPELILLPNLRYSFFFVSLWYCQSFSPFPLPSLPLSCNQHFSIRLLIIKSLCLSFLYISLDFSHYCRKFNWSCSEPVGWLPLAPPQQLAELNPQFYFI